MIFAAFFVFVGLTLGYVTGVAVAVREHQREDADRARRLEREWRVRG